MPPTSKSAAAQPLDPWNLDSGSPKVKGQAKGGTKNEQKKGGSKGGNATKISPKVLATSPPDLPPSPPKTTTPSPPLAPVSSKGHDKDTTASLIAGLSSHTSPTTAPPPAHDWAADLSALTDPPAAAASAGSGFGVSPPRGPATAQHHRGVGPNVPLGSTSPPAGKRRPLSHPRPYNNFAEIGPQEHRGGQRRVSMHSQRHPHPHFASPPPLPHHHQAHFYALPDADLGRIRGRGRGSVVGDGIFFCRFDTLAAAGDRGSLGAENVLLTGYRSGLSVTRVEKNKLDVIGKLEGLHGDVIGAKLLKCTARDDPLARYRPLVAVIIHGPEEPDETRSSEPQKGRKSNDVSTPSPEIAVVDLLDHPLDDRRHAQDDEVTRYQTTVQVFSLSTRERVGTLFRSPQVQISAPASSPLFFPPPAIGALQIEADGRFVVVASGISGEVYIFAAVASESIAGQPQEHFRCLGKVWTTVQPKYFGAASNASSSSESESNNWDHAEEPHHGTPLFSLSNRWLAYAPASRSMSTLDGSVGQPHGYILPTAISAHTSPPQPSATCTVDLPDGGGLLNRVTREVTQEFIKGAKWVGDQGLQAWRNYWNKPSVGNEHAGGFPGPVQPRDYPVQHGPTGQYFPPTHAHAVQHSAPSGDPALVSILDLEKAILPSAGGTARLSPVATFPAPLGCSFVSFAPEGLLLLTASKKGDVQYVWDLMRAIHGKHGPNQPQQGPTVRQVARFSRMTVATLVDVVWAVPRGERLAIVTSKGTVHLFDLPTSAFQWPPARQVLRPAVSAEASGDAGIAGGGDGPEPSNAMSAAIKMVANTTQPILTAAQRRRGSTGPGYGGFGGAGLATNGVQSGKYMAAGLSKSLGAATGTISSLRKAGGTRIHISTSGAAVSAGSVRWLTGKERGLMGVVGGGVLRMHGIGQKRQTRGHKRQSLVEGRAVEFDLPRVAAEAFGEEQAAEEDGGTRREHGVGGFWTLRVVTEQNDASSHGEPHPLSRAEIETNPPYQPFHTDSRVQMFAYQAEQDDDQSRDFIFGQWGYEAWGFGQAIARTKLNIGLPSATEGTATEGGVSGVMENVLQVGKDEDQVEQIVVTTRRRRRAKGAAAEADDGFFEDDCDVLDFATDRV